MYVKKIAVCLSISLMSPAMAQSIFEAPKQQSAASRLADAVAKSTTAAPTVPQPPAVSSGNGKNGPSTASGAAQPPVAPTVQPSAPAVSISEQSAQQAKALADEALRKMTVKVAATAPVKVVPELKADSAITVVLDKDAKKLSPQAPPQAIPKPYLSMVMGMAGLEIAEFQMPGARRKTLKAGETIMQWRISKIQDGSLYLTDMTPPKKVKVKKGKEAPFYVPPTKVLRVGEFL